MPLANLTTVMIKKFTSVLLFSVCFTAAFAQENAPYSRYGLGEIVPAQNIVSRGMGGVAVAFVDSAFFIPFFQYKSQSINLTNPAVLGSTNTTLFDVGGEVDTRTLKSNNSTEKYKATNTLITYLQLAFPITPKKMLTKGNYWNVAVGLRPVSRVNYKILNDKRITGIDSISTLFEGTGGLSQANISTGLKIKNFSFGVSTGYSFGNRETSVKSSLTNDTINYALSNLQNNARFGGLFVNLGAMYSYRLPNKNLLRIGATANLQQNLKAKRDYFNGTFLYNSDGEAIGIDTADSRINESGTVKLPASYTVGFTYNTPHITFGADVDYTTWSKYRYFNKADDVQDNFMLHVGVQYYPATSTTPFKKYWNFVKYRAGFYYGKDYVKINNTNRPNYALTLGAGLPLTNFQRLNQGEFVLLNTGLEVGQKGNKQNQSLREGVVRVNIGIAMSATWFIKRKYE